MSEPFSWALDAESLCDRFLRFHVFRHGWGLCTCGEKEWPGDDLDAPEAAAQIVDRKQIAALRERVETLERALWEGGCHYYEGGDVGSCLKHGDSDPCSACLALRDEEDFDPRDPRVNPIGAAKAARGRGDLVIDLNGCARCLGEGHPGLELRKFTHPADTGRGIIFTHWAPCPTNGEPILYASGVIMPEPLAQGKEMEEE